MINYSCDRCCAPIVDFDDVVSIETSDMNGSPLIEHFNTDDDTNEVIAAIRRKDKATWARQLCRACNTKVREFIDRWNDDAENTAEGLAPTSEDS